MSLTLLSLYELLHVCYRFRELCAGGTFRFSTFFQDHFFTRTLIFFRLTASPMTEPQNSLKNV
ncbi:hypothetical protein BOVAC1_4007 [Bacteroides ovatus]|nr:hypothetical protein BOVAC1_4007 [Bacteroides ovatus]